MKISSRAEPQVAGSFVDMMTNLATLGAAEGIQQKRKVESEDLRRDRLEDLRLSEPVRELLDREFRSAARGQVRHEKVPSRLDPGLEIQYTVASSPAGEWVLLDIPASILSDGRQVRQLFELYFLLQGASVRVLSRDLPGSPASAFNGLKNLWEQGVNGNQASIEFIPAAHLQELRSGTGNLENVLRIRLQPPTAPEPEPEPACKPEPIRTVRIFLASSNELKSDREEFVRYFLEKNVLHARRGFRVEIIRWEHFLDAVSGTRLQDEYNEAIKSSDIVLCLFHTKTGIYTEEEFDTAHQHFRETGKPQLFTYFNQQPISPETPQADLQSLWKFQEKLGNLHHFYTRYNNIDDLKVQFQDQLDRLLLASPDRGKAAPIA